MTLPFENNTSRISKKLAVRSLKTGKTRNLLIILTIMISVSLLSAFVLSMVGMNTSRQKQFQQSSHVLYRDVDTEQIEHLSKDTRTLETLLFKQAPSSEIDNYLVIPIYFEQKPGNILVDKIVEGYYPVKIDEIAVDKAFMRQIGQEPQLGNKITITFYNGITETFTVTGFTDNGSTEKIYSLYCSKEYAQKGSQLKNAITALAVQLKDTENMSKDSFEETANKLGTDYRISYKNIDENDAFAKSLSPNGEDIIIILLVSIFILFVSYLVIYSIFYIYIQNQIRDFGQLRTIGATAKQIRRMIKIEGRILCIVGTILGLPIGYVIAYLFKPDGWSLGNTLIASIAIFIFAYATVVLSLRKPAKIASSISPIEATRNSGYNDLKKLFSKRLHRKISPLSLAIMSVTRNRKKIIMTIVSLSVAGIMFMAGTTLIASLDIEKFARQGMMDYGEFIISISRNAKKNNEFGYTGVQMQNPLNEQFIEEISEINGIKELSVFKNLTVSYNYKDNQERDSLSPFTDDQVNLLNQYSVYGTINYQEIINNDEILILRNAHTEFVHGWKFELGDTVTFHWYDGKSYQSKQYKIAGEISDSIFKDPVGGKAFGTAEHFIAPQELLDQMMQSDFNFNHTVVVSINNYDDEATIRDQIHTLVDENPLLSLDTLYDYYEESSSMYQRTTAVIWGISGFTMLFAVINLINTLIANTLSRKQEFSILRSVGMSKRQLIRTIQYEGLILAGWNIIFTLLFGSTTGYGIVSYLNSVGDDSWVWNFPIPYFLGYILVALLLSIIISTVVINILHKKSLVEQLRDITN
ncbi:MAG: FtsX-like permease family protein [Clostridiaceae bacterium]